jgi:hypothetical protein
MPLGAGIAEIVEIRNKAQIPKAIIDMILFLQKKQANFILFSRNSDKLFHLPYF